MKELGARTLSEALGMERTQLSQLAGRNQTRNIGPSIARRIEVQFGKARGWMDIPHEL
jgi:hypothetical protein